MIKMQNLGSDPMEPSGDKLKISNLVISAEMTRFEIQDFIMPSGGK